VHDDLRLNFENRALKALNAWYDRSAGVDGAPGRFAIFTGIGFYGVLKKYELLQRPCHSEPSEARNP
jgi:hypothetical protein